MARRNDFGLEFDTENIRTGLAGVAGLEFRLIKVAFDQDDTTLEWGDLTEADFTGYAPVPFDAFTAVVADGVWRQFEHSEVTFTQSGTATNNTIFGWVLADAADNLYWQAEFGASINMNATGNFISFTPLFRERNVP